MATELRLRRGTDTQNDAFTGAEGEITVDTTKKQLRLHDGVTAGGQPIGGSNASDTPYDNGTSGLDSENVQGAIDEIADFAVAKAPIVPALYRRRVVKNIPAKSPAYETLISTYSYNWLAPQGFTIDWDNDQIFILWIPDGGTSNKFWVEVRKWSDLTYLTTFGIAFSTITFTESLVVRTEGGTRYLYVQNGDDSIGKYDITTLPTDLATATASSSITGKGLHSQFFFRDNKWMVQQEGPTVGQQLRRGYFAIYDDTLTNRLGSVKFSNFDVGAWVDSAYADDIPKAQNFAVGEGFYVAAIGGAHIKGDTPIPYSYTGVKVFRPNGTPFLENLTDPEATIAILEAAGFSCTRLEYEGVHVGPDGKVYTLCWTVSPQATGDAYNGTTGLLVLEELSTAGDALDFSEAARPYASMDLTQYCLGVWPRSRSGKLHNPITGTQITTWEQICDLMLALDLPRFEYYSTATTTITGIGGEIIPAGNLVEFHNADNNTFKVALRGFGTLREYTVSGTPGARTCNRQAVTLTAASSF